MNAQEQRRQLREEYIDSKKNVPCRDCGNSFPTICMDFHHVGDKDPTLVKQRKSMKSWMKRWSIKRIDEELDKCVVLCSNCHRIRHAV